MTSEIIESAPITIVAEEPIGDDLGVWEKIKGNRKYAYFIQTGGLKGLLDSKALEVAQDLQQLLDQYPNSRYGEKIQTSLREYQKHVGQMQVKKDN